MGERSFFQNLGVCLPANSRRTSGRRFCPSLFRTDRSDDRKYVCCSQARGLRASVSFFLLPLPLPLPLPRHSFFFALVPIFLDELARKHLLRRLGTWRPVGNVAITDYGAFHKRMTQKKVTGNGNVELLACSM